MHRPWRVQISTFKYSDARGAETVPQCRRAYAYGGCARQHAIGAQAHLPVHKHTFRCTSTPSGAQARRRCAQNRTLRRYTITACIRCGGESRPQRGGRTQPVCARYGGEIRLRRSCREKVRRPRGPDTVWKTVHIRMKAQNGTARLPLCGQGRRGAPSPPEPRLRPSVYRAARFYSPALRRRRFILRQLP